MKKILSVSILLVVFLPVKLYAQKNHDKAYEKRSSVITAGYGIGNLWTIFLDKVYDIPDYKVRSTGPFTLVYEYGILNRFSLGIAGSYSRVKGKAPRFQIADQITFLSLLARANYHIWTSKKLDPYFGGGIGISNSRYKNLDPHTILDNPNSKVPSTIDYSVQLGLKYFPATHIGFCIEAGYISGAVVLVGVTARF